MKTNEEIIRDHAQYNVHIFRTAPDGGVGSILLSKKTGICSVIWSFGAGWDHVSVSPYNMSKTPNWDDMCILKDAFFHKDEWAVEFHPAESEYVNNMPNCLHIWRPQDEKLPTPPAILTGIKELGEIK